MIFGLVEYWALAISLTVGHQEINYYIVHTGHTVFIYHQQIYIEGKTGYIIE